MVKEENKTVLKNNIIVLKNHPRIAFRGEIDALMAECLFCMSMCKKNSSVYKKLCAIKKIIDEITRCEALDKQMEFCGVFGYNRDEIREVSHNPQKYLGADHMFLTETDELSLECACLNKLRTKIRDCERSAVCLDDYNIQGIVTALNCLSSAVYILMIEQKKSEI